MFRPPIADFPESYTSAGRNNIVMTGSGVLRGEITYLAVVAAAPMRSTQCLLMDFGSNIPGR
jgi:hypothetical protein